MENDFIQILIVMPMALFFSGFLMARQLRPLANAPLISKIFLERKLFFGASVSLFLSLIFTFISSPDLKFSNLLVIRLILLFILGTTGFYLGATLGFGHTLPENEFIAPTAQTEVNKLSENMVLEDLPSSIKILINTQKRWGLFVMSAIQLIVAGFCGLPLLAVLSFSSLQKVNPQYIGYIVSILVGSLVLYLLYAKFQEVLEYIYEKEVIEINDSSVRIEQSGSGFKSIKEFPADNIRQITTMFPLGEMPIKHSPFVNKNFPAFLLRHNRGLKRHRSFGRAIDLADAQRILGIIYSKFPQYKG